MTTDWESTALFSDWCMVCDDMVGGVSQRLPAGSRMSVEFSAT